VTSRYDLSRLRKGIVAPGHDSDRLRRGIVVFRHDLAGLRRLIKGFGHIGRTCLLACILGSRGYNAFFFFIDFAVDA
jgi:hypothetical protein